ncbi:gluconate:H+ symporter [Thioclava sp. GXIMD2076]|uniref:GntP family permease n=1 Tax=Thioclava sp. GXIMD2076 TaxID=3131931 RepID=UPI0030CF4337
MTSSDIQLLAIALAGVLFLVGLIVSRIRLHPLLALLVTALAVGLAVGMPVDKIVSTMTGGAGKTLSGVGLVIALGAMLGKILADTGVTESISEALIRKTPAHLLPWAMAATAFVVGIPMFFEVGLVVMLPLIFSVARKLKSASETPSGVRGSSYMFVGVPVIAALASMHGMVPPHPGPLTAIAALDASVGATMIYGFCAAIPAIILAGPVYGRFIAPKLAAVRPDGEMISQFTEKTGEDRSAMQPPSAGLSLLTALMPALLMLLHSLTQLALPGGSGLLTVTAFLGNPVIAMLLSVLFAALVLVYLRQGDAEVLRSSMTASLRPIGNVLLIIAGGGAFQHVLAAANVGDAIMHLSLQFHLSPLLLGWIIAMLLSVSTGSATVGIVGAAGLLAPLAGAGNVNTSLLALSIGAGSLFFNYANHAGFWLVKESFSMSMKEATLSISIIQSIVALVGLAMVLVMNLLPAIG